MKKIVRPLLALSLLASAACSKSGDSGKATPQEVPLTPQTNLSSDITNGKEKIGEIRRVAAERKRATSLTPIPVDPLHNANVYKLSGIDDEPQYLVAPRLFVYGTKVRSLAKDPDGNIVIPFNISLIDGLSKNVDFGEANGQTTEIPQSLRVTDYEKLKEDIMSRESIRNPAFAVGGISGCPSRISIVVASKAYDVTPENMSESDYCELNRPFTVHLKVPEKTAQYILNDALRSKVVDVVANYAAMVPVPVSQLLVRFNKTKLFEAIQAELSAAYPPFGQAEVSLAVEKVFRASHMNINIQGDYNEQMQTLVSKAIETFFEPFKGDPKLPEAKKCDAMVCLSVRAASQSSEETFSVSMTQTQNMKMEKVWRLGSKLRPLNDQMVSFGRTPNSDPKQPKIYFSNKNPNEKTNPYNVYSVGLTPERGSLIEFAPTFYSWERRKRDNEVLLNHHHWRQCTGREGWDNHCSYTDRNEYLYTREFTGAEAWENVDNPLGVVPRLLSGIKFYFKFTNGEFMTCDLETMEGYNDDKKRVVKIDNSPQCPLFDVDRKVISDFGLINGTILDDVTYISGQELRSDYSKNWSTYKEETYSPEARMAGTLTLVGQGFISLQDIK